MLSIISISALVASIAVSVSAQTIDPNVSLARSPPTQHTNNDLQSVPIGTRDQWCVSQESECPLICLQTPGNSGGTDANDCDPTTLTYDCVCSNGIAPNVSEYSQTIPYFICTEYNSQCQTACGNDNTCAAACTQEHPCGAQNPTRVNTSTISTMSSTSSAGNAASTVSGSAVYTGFGGGAATTTGGGSSGATATGSSSSSDAARNIVLNFGQLYGLGVVATGIFAGFAILL